MSSSCLEMSSENGEVNQVYNSICFLHCDGFVGGTRSVIGKLAQ